MDPIDTPDFIPVEIRRILPFWPEWRMRYRLIEARQEALRTIWYPNKNPKNALLRAIAAWYTRLYRQFWTLGNQCDRPRFQSDLRQLHNKVKQAVCASETAYYLYLISQKNTQEHS